MVRIEPRLACADGGMLSVPARACACLIATRGRVTCAAAAAGAACRLRCCSARWREWRGPGGWAPRSSSARQPIDRRFSTASGVPSCFRSQVSRLLARRPRAYAPRMAGGLSPAQAPFGGAAARSCAAATRRSPEPARSGRSRAGWRVRCGRHRPRCAACQDRGGRGPGRCQHRTDWHGRVGGGGTRQPALRSCTRALVSTASATTLYLEPVQRSCICCL